MNKILIPILVVVAVIALSWTGVKAVEIVGDWATGREMGKLEGENTILIQNIKDRKSQIEVMTQQNNADWAKVEANRSEHARLSGKQ
ncbi:MAG: hypothetical protein GY861_18565 [bacterium]|nr:hypothetical protein [bacterium]